MQINKYILLMFQQQGHHPSFHCCISISLWLFRKYPCHKFHMPWFHHIQKFHLIFLSQLLLIVKNIPNQHLSLTQYLISIRITYMFHMRDLHRTFHWYIQKTDWCLSFYMSIYHQFQTWVALDRLIILNFHLQSLADQVNSLYLLVLNYKISNILKFNLLYIFETIFE